MLDRLQPNPGSKPGRKRVGRGPGSTRGRYCGRGVKGQGTRSGGKNRPAAFEGGQMPLNMRLPKKGFGNRRFKTDVDIVNLDQLARFGDGATIDRETLMAGGLARKASAAIKVLSNGEAPKNLTVKVNRISAAARQKIEAAGGSVELVK